MAFLPLWLHEHNLQFKEKESNQQRAAAEPVSLHTVLFPSLGSVNRTPRVGLSAEKSQKHNQRNPYQVKPTWFNYFSRRIFNHNLTSIKVLKCELKSTQCFNKSNLVCHMQIIHIPLEHLGNKGDLLSSTAITTPPDSLLRVHNCYLSLKFNVRATASVWSEPDSINSDGLTCLETLCQTKCHLK